MAIQTVALGAEGFKPFEAYTTGVQRRAQTDLISAQAGVEKEKVRGAQMQRLANAAFQLQREADPVAKARKFENWKRAAGAWNPDNAAEIGALTLDQMEAAVLAATTPEDQLKQDKLGAEIGSEYALGDYRRMQTQDIGIDNSRDDWKTGADIADANRRTGIYGAGVSNEMRNRDAGTALDYRKAEAGAYGQLSPNYVMGSDGRANAIPGAPATPIQRPGEDTLAGKGYRYTDDGRGVEPLQGFVDPEQSRKAGTSAESIRQLTASADNVIVTARQAIEETKDQGFRTGIKGSIVGMVPGTGAYRLYGLVSTIKANLGFDRLQQMRDASPTGGALGQVAVKELDFLQATIANLDPGLGEEQLRANLEKVIGHYENWKRAVSDSQRPGAGSGVLRNGAVIDGYRYRGGDPNAQSSWEPAR